MFGIVGYEHFILSAILLNLVPGSDTIYILSRAAVGGRRCGAVSALGISTGILIHTVLAALGLSVILAQSALAFNLVKAAGALYLIVLGVRTILSRQTLLDGTREGEGGQSLAAVWRQGVLTNALNPKVALFFLALLPQFVTPGHGFGPVPFLLLGLTFCATSTVWSLILAFLASFFSRLLHRSPAVSALANKAAGCVYILLGLNVLRARAAA